MIIPLTKKDLVGVQTEEGWINRLLEMKQRKVKIEQFNRNKEPMEVRHMLKEVECLEKDQLNLLYRKTNNSKPLLLPYKLRLVVYSKLHVNMGHLEKEKTKRLVGERFYQLKITKDMIISHLKYALA